MCSRRKPPLPCPQPWHPPDCGAGREQEGFVAWFEEGEGVLCGSWQGAGPGSVTWDLEVPALLTSLRVSSCPVPDSHM